MQIFNQKNKGPNFQKGACWCVDTDISKKCLRNIFELFLKNNFFKKKSDLNTNEGGSGRPQTSFSQKIDTGKLSQTDGWKSLITPKMKTLHMCHGLQKLSKNEENNKNTPTHTRLWRCDQW